MNEDGGGGAVIRPTLSETMHDSGTNNGIFTRESAKEIIKKIGKRCNLIKLHLPSYPGDRPAIYFNPATIVYWNDCVSKSGERETLIRTTLSEGNDWDEDMDDIFVCETSKQIMAAISAGGAGAPRPAKKAARHDRLPARR
ncbi:MAG: hypothetical protein ACR2P5_01960 [Gammaproteobacteria bacterium]